MPEAKYVYVARDGRDVVWSMYNHHANANALWYEALNDTPGRVGPPIEPPPSDIRQYFREWLERDGFRQRGDPVGGRDRGAPRDRRRQPQRDRPRRRRVAGGRWTGGQEDRKVVVAGSSRLGVGPPAPTPHTKESLCAVCCLL
jgi:hypothetical protein